jgi:hypothetical protein
LKQIEKEDTYGNSWKRKKVKQLLKLKKHLEIGKIKIKKKKRKRKKYKKNDSK